MRSLKSIRILKAFAAIAFASSISIPALAESTHTYTDDKTKLESYAREINELQERIEKLIEEKHHADEKEEVKKLVDEIAENYRKLQKVSHDHEAMWLHIRFKHPEQAQSLEKQYTRFKIKKLEDMEAETGIDGRLDRIKARVMATFPAPEQVKEKKDDSKISPYFRKPASVDEDAPEQIKLSK